MDKKAVSIAVIFLAALGAGYYAGTRSAKGEVSVLFCPEEDCMGQMVEEMDGATSSVHAAVRSVTSPEIARALMRAHERGVEVLVVIGQEDHVNPLSQDPILREAGLRVRYDGNTKGWMNDKFVIVDGRVVITGSPDWTEEAWRYNDENLLLVSSEETVKAYETEFAELWSGVYGK